MQLVNFAAKEIVRCETSCLNRVTLGNVSCNLSRVQKGVVLLGDAKRRCDTSRWDDVTVSNN